MTGFEWRRKCQDENNKDWTLAHVNDSTVEEYRTKKRELVGDNPFCLTGLTTDGNGVIVWSDGTPFNEAALTETNSGYFQNLALGLHVCTVHVACCYIYCLLCDYLVVTYAWESWIYIIYI